MWCSATSPSRSQALRAARQHHGPLRPQSFVDVPSTLRSAWIFVLRAGTVTGAERHPNSIQRVMSFRGSADLQTWEENPALNSGAGGKWKSNPLGRGDGASTRWLTIPENVWHRPVVDPLDDWIVVSFHTAFADELIEERAGDDEHPDRPASQTLYAGRSAR